MIIGIPKEVKKDEYHVTLLPVRAELLAKGCHAAINMVDHRLVNAAIAQAFPNLTSGT